MLCATTTVHAAGITLLITLAIAPPAAMAQPQAAKMVLVT